MTFQSETPSDCNGVITYNGFIMDTYMVHFHFDGNGHGNADRRMELGSLGKAYLISVEMDMDIKKDAWSCFKHFVIIL